ncbi:MAG: signal peptidase I [Ruminiclostridium sp.]|nr:signal peptidase I [Ruminiclostridium sp.]
MKSVLKVIVNVLAWIVLIFALLITIIVFSSERNNGVANLFGFIPLTVESDSMKPTFEKGDLIMCHEIDDLNSLGEGDVITFWTIIDGKRVKNTHRIVGINQAENSRSFVTRGDNNSIDDTMPAYAGDIIGKWTDMRIPGFGKVMGFLRTKTGFFVCIIIPMAIFFLIELYKFIMTVVEVRRPAVEEVDEEEIKRRAIEEYLAEQKAKEQTLTEEKQADVPAAETKSEPAETAEVKTENTEEAKPKSAEENSSESADGDGNNDEKTDNT